MATGQILNIGILHDLLIHSLLIASKKNYIHYLVLEATLSTKQADNIVYLSGDFVC